MSATTAIKDRERMTDHVADVMQENWRSYSIDTLLCHPIEAIEMGIEVAQRSGRVSAARAKKLRAAVESLGEAFGPEVDALNEICRTAMGARKAGELKRDRH